MPRRGTPRTPPSCLCYPSPWCNLHRRLTAESGSLHKPEITPPRISTTSATAPNAGVEGSKADKVLDVVKEVFATVQPIPRSGVTDDIADAAVFLASDRASFVHGHD